MNNNSRVPNHQFLALALTRKPLSCLLKLTTCGPRSAIGSLRILLLKSSHLLNGLMALLEEWTLRLKSPIPTVRSGTSASPNWAKETTVYLTSSSPLSQPPVSAVLSVRLDCRPWLTQIPLSSNGLLSILTMLMQSLLLMLDGRRETCSLPWRRRLLQKKRAKRERRTAKHQKSLLPMKQRKDMLLLTNSRSQWVFMLITTSSAMLPPTLNSEVNIGDELQRVLMNKYFHADTQLQNILRKILYKNKIIVFFTF